MRTRVLAPLLCLVLLVTWDAFAQTAKPKPNASGAIGGVEPRTPLPSGAPPLLAHACLQLYFETQLWNIDVIFDPAIYPYVISGGTIKGTICGSPNVHVTGGILGSNLKVTATLPPPGCATPVNIVGTSTVPAGYQGTYGFSSSSTDFHHHTLFLGYNKPTCP